MATRGRQASTATRLGRMVRFADRSVQEIAADVGVSARTMSDWMSGRRLPSPPQQAALAQTFGVDRSFLFEDPT